MYYSGGNLDHVSMVHSFTGHLRGWKGEGGLLVEWTIEEERIILVL